MTADSVVLTLRADLVQRRIQLGDRFVWVLKDPLSRAFFYLSDRDYAILKMLDGRRKIAEILAACRDRFAPEYVAAESLIAFLADAKKNGLITSSAAANAAELRTNMNSALSGWKNPLALRLPGINPDRVLDLITPRLKPLFSPLAVCFAIVFAAVASLVAMVNFDQLVDHVAVAASRSSFAWVFVLGIVIAVTKVIHEAAHAVACKAFGAECREIGIMFLVGIPCLYCDVSDAWMLKSRWQRIIVSAAGMLAELTIAAFATLLWIFSNDGIVRDLSLTTMIVCSISTVLFNGNPLLRYDGYFILSDMLGIPNLAAESSQLIRRTWRTKLWSLASADVRSTDATLAKRSGTLYAYGFLSGGYRLLVLTLIAIMIYRFASGWGLGHIGAGLALILVVSTLLRMVRPIATPPTALEARSSATSRGPRLLLVAVGLCSTLPLFVPLPRSVVAPTSIDVSGAVDVFLESPGRLVTTVLADSEVQAGDAIATFRNHDTEQELARLEAVQQSLKTQLESLRQRRSVDVTAAAQIPSVTKALEAAQQRYAFHRTESERLVVRAPRSGHLFAPRNRPPSAADIEHVETWTQTPLSPQSRGAVFDQGTLIGTIGDHRGRDAIVLVRQQEISLVRPGQSVELLTQTHRRGHFTGIITDVASSPIDRVPREFFVAGLVDPSPHSVEKTRSTYYQVRVQLDQAENPPVVRSTAKAKIEVAPASLASRLGRFLSDSFRF